MNAPVTPQSVRAERIAFLGFVAAFVLAVVGMVLFRKPPSVGEATSSLRRLIEDDGGGRLAFVQLEVKVPEYVELQGHKAWAFQFTGEVEAKETCRWTGASLFSSGTFKTVSVPSEVESGFGLEKTSRVNVEGVIAFERPSFRWTTSEYRVRPLRMSYSPEPPPKPPRTNSNPTRPASAVQPSPTRPAARVNVPTPAPAPDHMTTCSNRLKQLGLAARIYASWHQDRFPTNFASLSNEITTPKALICPSDILRVTDGTTELTWANFRESKATYIIEKPGLEEGHPTEVFLRCGIHGWKVMGDGSVQGK
jgi:hypothetical protein